VQPQTISIQPLLLRPVQPADAEAIFLACQDPSIAQWTAKIPVDYTREDADEFVNVITPAGWEKDTDYTWAICEPAADVLLGVIGLHRQEAGRAELGYWMSRESRGRGLATQAATEVCRYAVEVLGLDVVYWTAIAGNEASRRIAERVGFQVFGPVRGLVNQRGTWRDGWVGTLLRGDRQWS
jgi:RimJ/RimL family protein N-acetyltransferase